MLKSRSAVLGLAIFLAIVGDSAGQSRRHPNQQEQTQSQQEKTGTDQRGTEQSPLFEQPLPTKKSAEEAARERREVSEKANSDLWTWRLSVLTVLALFGQATILAAQAYFLSGTLKATAVAANAAERQARILAAVEGPVPLVAGIKLVQYALIPGTATLGEISLGDHVDPGGPLPLPPHCRILICIENKGRTVLRLKEICIEKFIGATLPTQPTYAHIQPWDFFLEKAIWFRTTDELSAITPADVGAATATYPHGGAFWVYGYFAYLNLLDEKVEHKFLTRWDLHTGFIPDNRAGYT